MSQFEDLMMTYVGGLGASFTDLARAVKTALPHAPMPDVNFFIPYQVLANLKLSGNCSVGETIRTLVEAGVDHPNMPVVKSYIKENPWVGDHAYRHAFFFSNDMRTESNFLRPPATETTELKGPGYVFKIMSADATKQAWAGDNRGKTAFLKLKMDDGDSKAEILFAADGTATVIHIDTFVKHLNDKVSHLNLAVFDRDWVTKTVIEPLEAQLTALASETFGCITLDELGRGLWDHLALIRENPNPVQKSKSTFSGHSEEILRGTYYQARNLNHHSLEEESKQIVIYLVFYDGFQEAIVNIHGHESADGVLTYVQTNMQYKVRTGNSGYHGYLMSQLPDGSVFSRIRQHYDAVFTKLKEEQEAAPPADTPVE